MNSITGPSNCYGSFLNTLNPNGGGAGAFGLTTHDGNTFFSCTAQTYGFAASLQESGILSVSLNGILNTSTYLNYEGESMSFFPLVSPDGNYVYYLEASYAFDALVANRVPTSSTIYAIETNNLTKSWSVNLTSPVSDTGARLLSLTPDGSNLWVCYAGSSGGIDVISTENQNITNVPIYNCIQVAFSLDSSTAYITTSSAIVVVPTNNTSQTNTITLPNGDTPIAIAITTVGEATFAYVTANDSSGVIGAIYAIDLSNNNAITTVARGANISANTIEASADGNCVCATNLATLKMGQNNQDFFVIDTSNNSFLILSPDEQNVTGMVILPNNPS